MAIARVTSSTDFVRASKLTLQGEATDFVDDVKLEVLTGWSEIRKQFLKCYRGDQTDLALLNHLSQIRQYKGKDSNTFNHKFKQLLKWITPREQEGPIVVDYYLQGFCEELRGYTSMLADIGKVAIPDLFRQTLDIKKSLNRDKSLGETSRHKPQHEPSHTI